MEDTLAEVFAPSEGSSQICGSGGGNETLGQCWRLWRSSTCWHLALQLSPYWWNLKWHVVFLILWKWVGLGYSIYIIYIHTITHTHTHIYIYILYICIHTYMEWIYIHECTALQRNIWDSFIPKSLQYGNVLDSIDEGKPIPTFSEVGTRILRVSYL